MAMIKYTGTGVISKDDYHKIKYVGQTKGGKPVTIILPRAINMGNVDWSFAEKNEVVQQVVYTSVYNNTDTPAGNNTEENWEVYADDSIKGADSIILGVGEFFVDDEVVALTRGGGQFQVNREFREINADNDRGPVEGRIVIDTSTASLTLNALTALKMDKTYPAIKAEKVTEVDGEKVEETKKYTQEELEAMTVENLEKLAAELGYTITGSNKTEKIQSFLEAQK